MLNAKNINRQQWIAEAAYYKAVAKGVLDAQEELTNWLAAEQDYLIMLSNLQANVVEENGAVSRMGLRHLTSQRK
jgi:hypothetical protein